MSRDEDKSAMMKKSLPNWCQHLPFWHQHLPIWFQYTRPVIWCKNSPILKYLVPIWSIWFQSSYIWFQSGQFGTNPRISGSNLAPIGCQCGTNSSHEIGKIIFLPIYAFFAKYLVADWLQVADWQRWQHWQHYQLSIMRDCTIGMELDDLGELFKP